MSNREIEIHGHCHPDFEPVLDVFRRNFESGDDVGASFSVVHQGEVKVDIWAGACDEAGERPWQEDTIINVYSTTKTMSFLVALMLADRGELDFDAPVARYWPEFAANGKSDVLVSHVMAHSAGLSGLEVPTTTEDLYDHELIATRLAEQRPWWTPGSAPGYHAVTQGHLLGEIVRRITGVSLGTFFRTEIAEPLEADFHIGLAPEHDHRVGELIPPPAPPMTSSDPASIAARTFRSPTMNALDSRTEAWRRAEIPAAGGHGNARSVARIQGVVANGGEAFGHRLLSEAGARRALEPQIEGPDLVLGVPLRFGLGYGLPSDAMPLGPNENTCYWGGWGGSTIVVDFDARLALSYVMNKMAPGALGDLRGFELTEATYSALTTSAG